MLLQSFAMPPIPPSSSKAQSSADTELLVPFQPKSTCACAAAEDHNQTIPNIYLLSSGQAGLRAGPLPAKELVETLCGGRVAFYRPSTEAKGFLCKCHVVWLASMRRKIENNNVLFFLMRMCLDRS